MEKAKIIKNGNVNLEPINSGNVPVMPSLPLDRSFYKQCSECLKWRMIGTQCKNPLTMMCDNDERYFYKAMGI